MNIEEILELERENKAINIKGNPFETTEKIHNWGNKAIGVFGKEMAEALNLTVKCKPVLLHGFLEIEGGEKNEKILDVGLYGALDFLDLAHLQYKFAQLEIPGIHIDNDEIHYYTRQASYMCAIFLRYKGAFEEAKNYLKINDDCWSKILYFNCMNNDEGWRKEDINLIIENVVVCLESLGQKTYFEQMFFVEVAYILIGILISINKDVEELYNDIMKNLKYDSLRDLFSRVNK